MFRGLNAQRVIAANFKAAIFMFQLRKRHKSRQIPLNPLAWRKPFNVVATAAITLNLLAVGFPYLATQYNGAQARIPHPLASEQNLAVPPAADASTPGGKIAKLPPSVDAQLADDLKKQQDGKPQNHTHVQALAEDRTANDRVYLNADGTKSLVHSTQNTSFKDSSGNWQDVDTTLAQDPTTGNWHSKANSWMATFGDISTDGVQVNQNGQTFTFSPVGGKSVKPIVTGAGSSQVLTYNNVWQGVDLQYKVLGSELKESIVIKSKVAQSSFDFNTNGANLTPNPVAPGSFTLDGAFNGFTIAAASVTTADGASVGSLPTVSQTNIGSQIHVSLDATWLANQAVSSFPVVIDPSVFGPVAPNDYYNFSSTGTSCHGSVACGGQAAGNQGGTTNWRFAYQSNLTSIPAGEFPLQATLQLAVGSGSTADSTIYVDHSNCQTGFNCFDNAWGESSGTVGSFDDVDVTNVYQGAMSQGNTNPWMMVRGVETTGSNTYKLFDDTQTTLTITYEALPTQSVWASGSPANTGVAVTTQPTFFSSTSTDTDGPNPILYRYLIGTSQNVPAYNPYSLLPSVGGIIANSGQSLSTQWTVPDNTLQDGTTYYWQTTVWDGLSGAPEVYGPAYSFKVDLRTGRDSTQSLDTIGPANVDMATGNLETSSQSHSNAALGGDMGVNLDYNSPQVSRQGLVGSYYNDPGQTRTFPPSTTAPTYQRVDPNVDFNWGTGSPYTGIISTDNFLVRWTGYFVAPQDGTYQFGTTSDDGSRIFLNGSGTAYLDQWSANPTNVYGSSMALTNGQQVQVTYEYYEAGGAAQAHFLVNTSDLTINGAAKPIWLQTGVRPVATPHGLVGRYYTDDGTHNFPTQDDPTRLFLTRTDSSMSQNWGSGSPVPGGPSDNFMVRWTGFFTPSTTDTYTFGANVDDGTRITVNGTQVLNAWSDHSATTLYGTGIPLTAGTAVPITVDYYEHTGNATFSLYAKQLALGSGQPDQVVPTTSLSPQAQVLPDGWNLGIDADGNLNYDYATIGLNVVTLHDSTGQTHDYQFTNGGFTPPAGEDGHMVRNSDGTITFQDSDGRTYIFNPDGTLKSSSTPTDDLHPAALQYTYGGSPAHLTQITDGATSARWVKVLYAGDSNCPSVPTGFTAYSDSRVAGMICAVTSSDGTQSSPVNVANGNVTRFLYVTITHPDGTTAAFLSRVERPGSELTDYGFDSSDGGVHSLGRIGSVRGSLANDAVTAGVRAQDGTETTQIQYDALGHVSSVMLPAATVGASRLTHTYNYYPEAYTYMHVTGATETNGFTRKIMYDGTYRTTDDVDVANLDTKTKWDPAKDLVQSTTDPAGLLSTTLYDYDNRPTDQYGPAPSTMFDTNPADAGYDKPLTSPTDYTPTVPHKQTTIDGSINGLAAAFYDVDSYTNGTGQPTKALFGNPKLHTTGIGPANGDVNKTWGGTPPFTPDSGKGWGTQLTGYINLVTTGNYAFRIQADDGVRLWIDDTLVIDDWTDGANRSHGMVPGYVGFNNAVANSYHRVRLDYYNKAVGGVLDTDATLTLFMTPPGGGETSSLGSLLNPGYGLTTSQTTYDSSPSVGSQTTVTNYGTNPELGLDQSSTVDPSGQNLTTNYTYEAQGASGSLLRQLSKTLPGSVTTNYAYYGATDTADNPCTVPVEAFKQAGQLHTTTQPDPDGAGSQTSITQDNVYDDEGHVVASRTNTDSWACTTYDARGRVTQKVIPADSSGPSRTIVYNYAVSGNPLVTSESDASGTNLIVTTVDLLGRTVSYQDRNNTSATPTNTTYDNLGRLTQRTGKMETELFVYDNNNRLTAQKLDGTQLATPTYDAYGRLQQVTYPVAGQLKLVVNRDTLGRVVGNDFTLGNGTTHETDAVTLSQSGSVVSGTELGNAKSYTYDTAGRLTAATLGTKTYSYSYAAPSGSTCNQSSANLNANKDSNRTSQTVNGATTTYCYDKADRLIASSDASLTTPVYDSHGNATSIGQAVNFNYLSMQYDSSDRAILEQDVFGNNYVAQYHYDPEDRVYERDENKGTTSLWNSFYGFTSPASTSPDYEMDNHQTVRERYVNLPGGVLFTVRNATFSSTSNVYTLPNVHGDTMATTNGAGTLVGTFAYEPFGKIISTTTPDNANGKADFDYLGRYEKQTETLFGNQPQLMGSRIYMSVMGRFTQVDPIEGGVDNNYVYPSDPVNNDDITGDAQHGKNKVDNTFSQKDQQRIEQLANKKGRTQQETRELQGLLAKRKAAQKSQEKAAGERRSRQSKDRPSRISIPWGRTANYGLKALTVIVTGAGAILKGVTMVYEY